ncbi:hypothetical protein GCM10010441_33780 [Kitasatospora paracochleata]|uniref:Uncharacterized protein n=1 Tax=Kitasatospora paracochleata TaxID=58354 RepID=A0ABT1IPF2_9ACTN|nr:hypothetical protein [Kitasatospora paracochleata]MCP2307010.1 hypothetical protein [Kitasatospora paracochleata]
MYTEPPARAGAASPTVHRVVVEERGSFCFAGCSCGWFAPGRRSRDRARRDAEEHLADPGPFD